jgi:hypothetical protein
MKNKLNRTILFGVLTLAAFLISLWSPEHTYAEKLSSFAFGALTAIFVANKQQLADKQL